MATSRTAKIQAEIEKARAKLADQQSRLKELEAKRVEIENTEIVDIVRGMNVSLDDLAAFLQTIKGGAEQSLRGRVPKPNKIESEDTTE